MIATHPAASDGLSPFHFRAIEETVLIFGPHVTVDFGVYTNATIRRLGGWPLLCRLAPRRRQTSYRRSFCRIYAELRTMGGVTAGDEGRPLFGLIDAENRREGFLKRLQRPVRIFGRGGAGRKKLVTTLLPVCRAGD